MTIVNGSECALACNSIDLILGFIIFGVESQCDLAGGQGGLVGRFLINFLIEFEDILSFDVLGFLWHFRVNMNVFIFCKDSLGAFSTVGGLLIEISVSSSTFFFQLS